VVPAFASGGATQVFDVLCLRPRALRPQPKRDPLGISVHRKESSC